jgi:hypothetical protein
VLDGSAQVPALDPVEKGDYGTGSSVYPGTAVNIRHVAATDQVLQDSDTMRQLRAKVIRVEIPNWDAANVNT